MNTTLHLAIPQLEIAAQSMADTLPALQKLAGYARAARLPAGSLRTLAAFLFDLPAGETLPIAALSRLADSGHWDAGWWLCLEPVHFRPDRDDLLLFGPENLELTQEEAAALAASVREYLAAEALPGENLQLEINEPQRWYLRFDKAPDCQFSDLPDVNGQFVGSYMPAGHDAAIFKSLLNQLQMLLHVHPVNKIRAEQGKTTANGVWLWGGGAFDEINPREWHHVWANAPLFRGLALLAGDEPAAVPENFNGWFAATPQDEHLVVLPATNPHELETEWLEPALTALQSKLLGKLVIYLPASGQSFTITPGALKRFWRRPRPLHDLFPDYLLELA